MITISDERKAELIAALRGASVAKENITPEYKKNLDLASRQQIDVQTSEGKVRCYIFTAHNHTENCPVHINLHGGGFVRPHVLRDEIYSAKIADAIGGIVVDVDYKLAPESPYPTAFNESYALCKWVFEQADEWKADKKRISIGGHSAGGNLAAALALKSAATADFKFCLQVIDYAALDMATDPADKPDAHSNMIPLERGRMFKEAYIGNDEATAKEPFCSPLLAPDEMLSNLPTTLIISAGKDNFRFEDEAYAARLAAAGVLVTVKRFLNSNHGFIVHCTDEWQEGQQLIINTIKNTSL